LVACAGGCGKKSSGGSGDDDKGKGDKKTEVAGVDQADKSGKTGEEDEADANADAARAPAEDAARRAAKASCTQQWDKTRATFRAGVMQLVELTSQSTGSLTGDSTAKELIKSTVKEVNDNEFKIEQVNRALEPVEGEDRNYEFVHNRDKEINECVNNAAVAPDPTAKVEVLEQRDETLTVRAGTFDTTYTKTRYTGTDLGDPYESLLETWVVKGELAQLAIQAKAVSSRKTTMNDVPYAEHRTWELIQLTVP
jgi:hypothetical protein